MSIPISQQDAIDLFDLPEVYLYVCDGKKECCKLSCTDLADEGACHHTSDASHALYAEHDFDSFAQFPSIRDDRAVMIRVEPIR